MLEKRLIAQMLDIQESENEKNEKEIKILIKELRMIKHDIEEQNF